MCALRVTCDEWLSQRGISYNWNIEDCLCFDIWFILPFTLEGGGLMQGKRMGPVFIAQRFVDWERRWCLLFLAFLLTSFVKVWMTIFFTDYLMECSRLL